jgi:hypothetical protein
MVFALGREWRAALLAEFRRTAFLFCTAFSFRAFQNGARAIRSDRIDMRVRERNTQAMTRSEVVRRVKSYSAATGYVYQYHFYEVQKTRRGLTAGTEYVYLVSADRKRSFPVRIFVRRDATEKWARKVGRPLSGTEEYAVAKMRLFQALDETADVEAHPLDIVVDDSNLETLLTQLDL